MWIVYKPVDIRLDKNVDTAYPHFPGCFPGFQGRVFPHPFLRVYRYLIGLRGFPRP